MGSKKIRSFVVRCSGNKLILLISQNTWDRQLDLAASLTDPSKVII